VLAIPVPVLLGVSFLAVPAFHEFRPVRTPNVTVTVVLFLCALAVAGAIQTILGLSRGHPGLCPAAETRSRSDQPSEKQSSLKLTLFRALRGEKVASFGAVEFRHQGHRKRFAVTPENMVISQYA